MSFFEDFLSITDPGAGALFGGLFGGDDNASPGNTYTIRNGRVYSSRFPGDAGVPISNIPGTSHEPRDEYRNTAEQIRAIQDLLPFYTKAITDQLANVSQAELDSSKQTSPGYAQLMLDLYEQYGPQLNQVGSDIARQNALNQARTDTDVLKGPGGELVRQAYDTAQIFDKPWYDTRGLTADRLAELIKSIDLEGGLSATERREIEQSLALQGDRRGTYNAPSSTETVSNAMTYGNAGRNRVVENQNQLSKAIAASAAFLPAAKSGVDVFQVATGRPSMPNTGESKFPGIDPANTDQISNLANGLLGSQDSAANRAAQLSMNASNIEANKKDWLDQFVQFTQGVGNLASAAGGVAGMCWVAREVYGAENPRWLMFRDWLGEHAPMWFFKLYVKHGEQFARYIHNKPKLKYIIKCWMNRRIKV